MALILIVDDSLLQRKIIGGIVGAKGHEILEASDGHLGLEKALTTHPDCIITDLTMPNMDGFELLLALSKKGIKTPSIVVTADIQRDAQRECLELGASQVVHKPIKEETLLGALNNALHQRKEVIK